MFYDPIAKLAIVAAVVDKVAVTPTRHGAKTIILPQGKEIAVSASGVSPLAPIGKAGARGGIDAEIALDRVLALIDRVTGSCKLTAARIAPGAQAASATAWTVTVPVQGKATGTSSWRVAAGKASPSNAIAQQLAAGCP